MTATPRESRGQKSSSFRVGRVQAYLRGRVWYLRYQEEGQRRQPRVGPDRQAARQLAAEINAQLEVGAPSALGFEPLSISELRDKGIKYILETCSTLFNFAARHRHLPPYAENPFRMIEVRRIPVEDSKPIDVVNQAV